MAQEVKLTTDGMLLNWLKEVGQSVSAGEIIAEVEADKATVEIEAPSGGTIVSLNWEVGEEKEEGAVIATIGEAGESAASSPAKSEDAKSEEAPAPEPSANGSANGTASSASNGASVTEDGRVKASPVARNVAEDKGIDLSQVQGTGPGGRIVKADVESFEPGKAAPAAKSASAPASGVGAGTPTWGKLPEGDNVEIIEINRMRRAIADGTIISKSNIPHFYVTVSIDVDPMLKLRKEINASLEDDGVKVSVNDMLMKAAALALRKFPNLNSHYYGDKIVRYKDINIGVSVALPNNGLMNVVAHNADKRALSDLAVENKAMYERAREGKIKPADLKGATFTISNLGPYNVDHFSAIISAPEAGILAIGSAKKVPVVKPDGTLGVGNMMSVTISVDHRVSDGAEGAEYMQEFRSLVENPMRLMV
ncbi:MAG: dihydrolipoamide acetyltransferase family protein [Aggregatilineales bacterium]